MSIKNIIARYNDVNKERRELNKQIEAHYKPLLTEAGQNKDKVKFDELFSEIPDCPFLMTAYRMQDLHKI